MDCLDIRSEDQGGRDCRRCYFSQVPALNDRFYLEAVRPYCWFAAFLLFLSYVIGLWFTLRTHAAVIWNNEVDEKKEKLAIEQQNQMSSAQQGGTVKHRLTRQPTNLSQSIDSLRGAEIRDSQLYKRILGQSLKQVGLSPRGEDNSRQNSSQLPQGQNGTASLHIVPPKSAGDDSIRSDLQIPGLSDAQNTNLIREVAEMAATAATIAARDAQRPRKSSANTHAPPAHNTLRPATGKQVQIDEDVLGAEAVAQGASGGGHDAPNWSRMKSSVILMGATILYALIAEILVNTVDVVLEGVAIDEKFLGITLFALVPNTTEFLVSPPVIHKMPLSNNHRTLFHSP